MKDMRQKISWALVALLIILFSPNAGFGYPIAGSLKFPMDNYLSKKGENYFGRKDYVTKGKWHLGDDLSAKVGTNIYAIGAGIVRHAKYHASYTDGNGIYHKNYGGMYIIEHSANGEKVCALYVHMNIATFTKKAGQEVTKGEYLGQVGNQQQNGDYPEHFHFGIRKGEYPANPNAYIYGDWIFSGYTMNEIVLNDWYNPTEFIKSHQSTSYTFSSHAYTGNGDVQGGAKTDWNYSLPVRKSQFTLGETAKAIIRVENISIRHKWYVEIWRGNDKAGEYGWGWNEVEPWVWKTSYFWPEQTVNVGEYQFRVYLYVGDGSRRDSITNLTFTVVRPVDRKSYATNTNGYTGYGPPDGGADTDWRYALPEKTAVFNQGDHAYGLVYVSNISADHRWLVRFYRDKVYYDSQSWGNNLVGQWIWQYSYFWPVLWNAPLGKWEMRVFLENGGREDPICILPFTVVKPAGQPYLYDGNGHTGYGPPYGGADYGWKYFLPRQTTNFNQGDRVYALIRIDNVHVNHKFYAAAYRDNVPTYAYAWGWNDVGGGRWDTAYFWPEIGFAEAGNWRFEICLEYDGKVDAVDTLHFTVKGKNHPSQPAEPNIRFDFTGHSSEGWTTGYDTANAEQDQPDAGTWMVVARGPNPGIVSPELPPGFSTSRTPQLRFSVKVRGLVRESICQVWLMDNNGRWGYETRFSPVRIDYDYHEYLLDLSPLGDIPIRRLAIELTQDAPYEQWVFDWVELK